MSNLTISDISYFDRIRLRSIRLIGIITRYYHIQKSFNTKLDEPKKENTLVDLYQACRNLLKFYKRDIITREKFFSYMIHFQKEKNTFKQLIKKYLVESYNSRHEIPYDLPDNASEEAFFTFFYNKFEQFDIYSMYLDLEYWFDLLYSVKDSIFKEMIEKPHHLPPA